MRTRFAPALLTLMLGVFLISPAVAADDAPALIAATKRGDLQAVESLLAGGAEPDVFDTHRNTALIFAARDGHLEITRRLLAAGAAVNWIDGEGVTALILAAFKNHPKIARLLLDQGADTDIIDKWNRTALDYALRRGADDPIAEMIKGARQDD